MLFEFLQTIRERGKKGCGSRGLPWPADIWREVRASNKVFHDMVSAARATDRKRVLVEPNNVWVVDLKKRSDFSFQADCLRVWRNDLQAKISAAHADVKCAFLLASRQSCNELVLWILVLCFINPDDEWHVFAPMLPVLSAIASAK
jgi:hypothetical protein